MTKTGKLSVYVALGVLVGSFWVARWAAVGAREAWRETYSQSSRPTLAHGLLLTFNPFVRPAVSAVSGSRSVAIVYSDTCQYCQDEMPTWKRLIATAELDPDDRFILVSRNGSILGSQLEQELLKAHRRFAHLTIVDHPGFVQATGISWTPATVVLDDRLRVRIASERVTPVVERQIRLWFAGS